MATVRTFSVGAGGRRPSHAARGAHAAVELTLEVSAPSRPATPFPGVCPTARSHTGTTTGKAGRHFHRGCGCKGPERSNKNGTESRPTQETVAVMCSASVFVASPSARGAILWRTTAAVAPGRTRSWLRPTTPGAPGPVCPCSSPSPQLYLVTDLLGRRFSPLRDMDRSSPK